MTIAFKIAPLFSIGSLRSVFLRVAKFARKVLPWGCGVNYSRKIKVIFAKTKNLIFCATIINHAYLLALWSLEKKESI
jgi:hypothetical protein